MGRASHNYGFYTLCKKSWGLRLEGWLGQNVGCSIGGRVLLGRTCSMTLCDQTHKLNSCIDVAPKAVKSSMDVSKVS